MAGADAVAVAGADAVAVAGGGGGGGGGAGGVAVTGVVADAFFFLIQQPNISFGSSTSSVGSG